MLLPAVRANASLRELSLAQRGARCAAARDAEAFVAARAAAEDAQHGGEDGVAERLARLALM